jgi:hypothetical protein
MSATPFGAMPPPMMPGMSTFAFNAGSSGRLTQNGMSIALTTMPIRPPGRVTRTISDSISSASPSSNTVDDKATSIAPSGSGNASARPSPKSIWSSSPARRANARASRSR